jgi:hypothetical protein
MDNQDRREGILAQMLHQGNATVVWAALQELARSGGQQAIDIIDPLTRHSDPSVRQTAEEAIQRIQARLGGTPVPPPPPPTVVQVRPRPRYVPPPTATPVVPPSVVTAPPPPPPVRAVAPPSPVAPPPPAKSRTQQAVAESVKAPTEMGAQMVSAAPLQEQVSSSAAAPAQSDRLIAGGALPPPADIPLPVVDMPAPAPQSLIQPPLPSLGEIPALDWEKRGPL